MSAFILSSPQACLRATSAPKAATPQVLSMDIEPAAAERSALVGKVVWVIAGTSLQYGPKPLMLPPSKCPWQFQYSHSPRHDGSSCVQPPMSLPLVRTV